MVGGLLPHYQREVLDAFVLGRFEDLLLAVAKSPAMRVYLDNWSSTAPRENVRRRGHASGRSIARRAGRGGINENYARELLARPKCRAHRLRLRDPGSHLGAATLPAREPIS